jgi:hypothetical protein
MEKDGYEEENEEAGKQGDHKNKERELMKTASSLSLTKSGVKQGSLHFGQGVKQKLRTIV